MTPEPDSCPQCGEDQRRVRRLFVRIPGTFLEQPCPNDWHATKDPREDRP